MVAHLLCPDMAKKDETNKGESYYE
jgi:hypothetical protein